MGTSRKPLIAERLREVLHYDPVTGVFTRLIGRSNAPAGSVAGSRGDRYLRIMIDGVQFNAHRLAWLYMTGAFSAALIDHRDGDGFNNRWGNLREATPTQNMFNARIGRHNRSGRKGVSWCGWKRMWCAQIMIGGSPKKLGYFLDLDKAAAAYIAAAREICPDFARAA